MNANKDYIDDVLSLIQISLSSGLFRHFEDEKLELKDLSTGNEWTSLKETICAYLNTNGGYVICGIKERNNLYNLTGFDRNNEGRIIELRSRFFQNDNNLLMDLSDNISFEYKEVLGKTIAVIKVLPLSEDLKFVKFNDIYFERILTQDKQIPNSKISHHREYKNELEYSKEISSLNGTSIEDLDIDKINQFIIKINATGKKETVKKDLDDATDFLKRRYCIKSVDEITVLGLLLFGKEPFRYLEYRAEVDCYFETGNEIGRDKRFFQDDVLNLMDDAFSFVWGHIKVGRSYVGGGRSEPEFPEKLVREVVNNALAHRDYTINKFITIKVNPGESIEIKNPGSFKHKMLIVDTTTKDEVRRIIPGVPETKNPKLANVLKAFDKIESQGIGMATLVSVCLENTIDVPYYDLATPDSISLVIPSGKLMDEEMERWINSFLGYIKEKLNTEVRLEHKLVLAYFLKSERLNKKGLYTIQYSRNNNHSEVFSELKDSGLIVEHPTATIADAPLYILSHELTMVDFISQIETLTQQEINKYDEVVKKVLNIVYRYNKYNKQSIKPSLITPELYALEFGKNIEPTKYESLGRRVRKICGDLFKIGILVKQNDKSYSISNLS